MNIITKEEIEKRIKKKFGNDIYEIIGETNGMESNATFKHLKCGRQWTQYPYNFLKGIGCSTCNKKEQYNKITQNEFENEVKIKYGEQYTVIKYYNNRKVEIIHNFYFDSKGNKVYCNNKDIVDGYNLLHRKGKRSTCKSCRFKTHIKHIDYELLKNIDFCVYMHKNKINNKRYIGITSQNLHTRWSYGYGYIGQSFFNAIKKYGWENFSHYLYDGQKWHAIDENDQINKNFMFTFNKAHTLEKDLIRELRKELGREKIYNISDGGEGTAGVHKKGVNQFSLEGTFLNHYESIKLASKDNNIAGNVIGNCCRKKQKHAGGFIWRYDNDTSEIILPTKFSFKNISIMQFSQMGKYIRTYNSIADASKAIGISGTVISGCCDGKYLMAGNYQWKRLGSDKIIEPIYKYNPHTIKVYQYDLKGNFIKEYNTSTQAKKETGVAAITQSCKGLQAQSGGYIWVYTPNDVENHLVMLKEKRNVNQKNVLKFDLQGNFLNKYSSVKECAHSNNANPMTISRCCNEKVPTCKGYIYLHEEEENALQEKLKRKLKILEEGYLNRLNNRKKVAKCDLATKEILTIYNSIADATKENNIKSKSCITNCLRGKSKSGGGYFWIPF